MRERSDWTRNRKAVAVVGRSLEMRSLHWIRKKKFYRPSHHRPAFPLPHPPSFDLVKQFPSWIYFFLVYFSFFLCFYDTPNSFLFLYLKFAPKTLRNRHKHTQSKKLHRPCAQITQNFTQISKNQILNQFWTENVLSDGWRSTDGLTTGKFVFSYDLV